MAISQSLGGNGMRRRPWTDSEGAMSPVFQRPVSAASVVADCLTLGKEGNPRKSNQRGCVLRRGSVTLLVSVEYKSRAKIG